MAGAVVGMVHVAQSALPSCGDGSGVGIRRVSARLGRSASPAASRSILNVSGVQPGQPVHGHQPGPQFISLIRQRDQILGDSHAIRAEGLEQRLCATSLAGCHVMSIAPTECACFRYSFALYVYPAALVTTTGRRRARAATTERRGNRAVGAQIPRRARGGVPATTQSAVANLDPAAV